LKNNNTPAVAHHMSPSLPRDTSKLELDSLENRKGKIVEGEYKKNGKE
jgi:hypothetical protein